MPRVTTHMPTLMDLLEISYAMREIDRREVFAGRFNTPEALAMDIFTQPGFADVFYYDGAPAAVCGGREAWSGVWNVFAFGTDLWDHVVLDVTRHIVRNLTPAIIRRGGWRGQCYSHQDHLQAHRWLEWLGFRHEGTLRQFGRDGSDFLMYGWLAPDHLARQQWWGRRAIAPAEREA